MYKFCSKKTFYYMDSKSSKSSDFSRRMVSSRFVEMRNVVRIVDQVLIVVMKLRQEMYLERKNLKGNRCKGDVLDHLRRWVLITN